MATIKSQLVLVDGMTAPLRSVNKAMSIVIDSFEAMQNASGQAVDTTSLSAARAELARMDAQMQELGESTRKAGSSTDLLTSKILKVGAAMGAAFSAKKIIELADTMTQTSARLNMLTGSPEETEALQNKIMQSANQSRASYQSTADAVAKMGIMARDSFSSTDELVAFTELINKQFTIAGTSAAGVDAAMLQLTQAMASGVLRGEELNSVFEQAPTIIQTIADYLDVPIGQIRSMAAEGQITADIVKNAMLSSAGSINEQFESMPYTFSQVWTMIQNNLLAMFEPLIQVIGAGAQFIYDHWSILEPIFIGLATAIAVFTAAQMIHTAVTWLAVAANRALVLSLLASPYTWIAIAIGVVVAVLYKAIQAVGGFKHAWEICKAAVLVAASALQYGIAFVVVNIAKFVAKLVNVWIDASTAIPNAIDTMKANALMKLQNMVNGAIDIINSFINLLNKIPGVSIEAIAHVTFGAQAMAGAQANIAARNQAANDKKGEWADIVAELDSELNSAKSAFNAAKSNFNTALSEGISAGKSSGGGGGISGLGGMVDTGLDSALGGIGSDTSGINDSAGKAADSAGSAAASLSDTSEDLKYLRDIAEQEVINRFTTAEVKIDMSGMTNRIDSDMDLDGVLSVLTDGFAEALEVAAEGVHS